MTTSDLAVERLDETRRYSTAELCTLCRIEEGMVVALLEHGVIERHERDGWTWQSVRRVTRAVRVQRDFEIELAAVPLVLDLLDTLERQRRELRTLRAALDDR